VSGSSDKTIRVWKISSDDDDDDDNDADVRIVDECVFEAEEGIRKILFLENHPDLILAGDLVSRHSLQFLLVFLGYILRTDSSALPYPIYWCLAII